MFKKNLLRGKSYNKSYVISSKFHSESFQIEDFDIQPYNTFNPISKNGEVYFLNLLPGMQNN